MLWLDTCDRSRSTISDPRVPSSSSNSLLQILRWDVAVTIKRFAAAYTHAMCHVNAVGC